MGTKFRTMLAPINASTGDGRRFQSGAIELAPVPFPFEWARAREGGHDGAVTIGAVQETAIMTVAQAITDGWVSKEQAKGLPGKLEGVFAKGEMLDHASREDMPRLAEDVAEVMTLIDAGTLGPSVDLDSFEGVPVMEGSDTPVSYDELEAYWEETGEEPKLELLITAGRVRAATLVSIPAFQETSRPLELIAEVAAEGEAAADSTPVAALIASVAGQTARPAVADFARELDGPTPITYDQETGRVFGHIATWRTCHVGFEGVCITPPRDDEPEQYSRFNRYAVETEDGIVWAGRLTVGGRHAGLNLNASQAMATHDGKTVVAYVRAYSDEHGIAVAGVLEPDLDATTWATLERRKVSGDWRETPDGLSLIEVLALSPGPRSHSEPGFPVAETFSRAGRQVALTAALGPEADTVFRPRTGKIDIEAAVARALKAHEAEKLAAAEAEAERAALDAALQPERDEERAALAAVLGGE